MIQADTPTLLLASASSARRALLEAAGVRFACAPVALDEEDVRRSAQADGLEAGETAVLLADMKARLAARRAPDALVIGADQILVCGDEWFAKPPDLDAARRQLAALRGRTHRLETGVVCRLGGHRVWQHLAAPRLTMRPFSDDFLSDYLALEGEAALGSVGCYRLEGLGAQLFDRIEGEHTAILGLPLLPLLGFLRQHGMLAE